MRHVLICLSLCLALVASGVQAAEPPLRPEIRDASTNVAANRDLLPREWAKEPEYLQDTRLADAMCLEVERQTEAVITFWTDVATDPILFCQSLVKRNTTARHA